MDGKGGYTDPDYIGVERLWRTVKCEEVYLRAYAAGREAKVGIDAYFHFYNNERPHQGLGYQTPAQVFNYQPGDASQDRAEGRCLPEGYVVTYRGTAGDQGLSPGRFRRRHA